MVHFPGVNVVELFLVRHEFRGDVPQPMIPRPFLDQISSVQSSALFIRLLHVLDHFRHEMTSTAAEHHLPIDRDFIAPRILPGDGWNRIPK